MKAVHHDLIKQRAHEIWEEKGRPEGHDKEHWAQAEQELLEAAQTINAKSETEAPATSAVAQSEAQTGASEGTTKSPLGRQGRGEAASPRAQ
jgi:hypothetical protein